MPSYNEIQTQLAQKAQGFGTRTAQLPQAPNTANDSELVALRGQHADKLQQLFKYDTERASVTYNPGEAPGPHAEGYTPPTDRIIDPMIGARAASTEVKATAGELGDILGRMASRKDLLQDTYQKGMDIYNAGIEAQKLEFDALNTIFSNAMKIKDYEAGRADKKAADAGQMSMQDFLKMMGYGEDDATTETPASTAGGSPPPYTPSNPNVTVNYNGGMWKYNSKAGGWNQVGESETAPPSYFVPD